MSTTSSKQTSANQGTQNPMQVLQACKDEGRFCTTEDGSFTIHHDASLTAENAGASSIALYLCQTAEAETTPSADTKTRGSHVATVSRGFPAGHLPPTRGPTGFNGGVIVFGAAGTETDGEELDNGHYRHDLKISGEGGTSSTSSFWTPTPL